MKSIFKLEKQGDLGVLSYQPNQGPQSNPEPTFFESLKAAEAHLAKALSCDVQRVLNGPVGRIYKSHLGTFALIEHPLVEHVDVDPSVAEANLIQATETKVEDPTQDQAAETPAPLASTGKED